MDFYLLVQGLGSLTDTTGKTIVDECGLEHFRESGVDIHHTSGSSAVNNKIKKEQETKMK